jgi:hypothetical protein
MYVAFDQTQAEILREVLDSCKRELVLEIARADSHDYREMLIKRERVVEQLLSKLSEDSHRALA